LPDDPFFVSDLNQHCAYLATRNVSVAVVAQMVFAPQTETVEENISRMMKRLHQVAELNPLCINSQTGKDFYSFDDNCRILEAAMNFSVQRGIPVLHETHRGKFSFHLATLLPYLNRFPEMRLTADFSHFCVVSESLLEDQTELIETLIPHIGHIHARVGFSQAAQVNDPMAPEWEATLKTHTGWWQKIVDHHLKTGQKTLTITPEFGPAPYMPALPFTQQPIGNQWDINIAMMHFLKKHLKTT
jgi:sugar phosphate isomerase/epimerase